MAHVGQVPSLRHKGFLIVNDRLAEERLRLAISRPMECLDSLSHLQTFSIPLLYANMNKKKKKKNMLFFHKN